MSLLDSCSTGYDVPVEDIRRRLLESDARGSGARMMAIQEAVAAAYGMRPIEIYGTQRRTYHIARPRMLSMALCARLVATSLEVIAEAHGCCNHTSTIYARKRMRSAVEQICDHETQP